MSAGRYEIRLKGRLGARWAVRFDGMTLTTRPDGTTVIEGPVVDQAALHGLLRTLGDLGLPLLSVTQLEDPSTGKETPTAITVQTRQPTGTKGVPMDSTRRTSFVTGVLFLITFVTSIPAALLLYTPVLGMHLHRHRHRQPPCGRDPATGLRGSCRRRSGLVRHRRQVARRGP